MDAITEIAHGLRFPEGPVAMPDGSVVLVEIERQTLSVQPAQFLQGLHHAAGHVALVKHIACRLDSGFS